MCSHGNRGRDALVEGFIQIKDLPRIKRVSAKESSVIKRSIGALLVAMMLLAVVASPASAHGKGDASDDASVAGVASANPNFDILVALVVEAGLADALSATGEADALGAVTVFAPTDRAFRRLVFELERSGGAKWRDAKRTAYRSSEAEIAELIIAATGGGGDGLLDEVLLYHVSNELGAVPFDVAKTLDPTPLPMLNGGTVTVEGLKGRRVILRDTNDVLNLGGKDSRKIRVIRKLADIPAGDDIIHGINRVLLP